MWWLDPGKEVLNMLFNRILAPYVVNLDMNQVNYGIGQGQLTLRNLTLKRGALDKFRLPVDVIEGHLGKFTLSLHWLNLGNQPAEILIEDVHLLVVPSQQATVDLEEEEQRVQAVKAERLASAELSYMRRQTDGSPEGATQSQGLWASLVTKIINNLQVTLKNVHVRYEDKLSVLGHPFAAGLTLAAFTAISVDEQWKPAFIESTAGAIHKLAKLQSLAVYFDTDSPSLAGMSKPEAVKKFTELIADGDRRPIHQYVLQPVSGDGRTTMNHQFDEHNPRYDVQLLFDEIGIVLDDNQYRDVISVVDMYHFYLRQWQFRKYRPVENEFMLNRPRALLKFAGTAILEGVRDRRRKMNWDYMRKRRDDRNQYMSLYEKKLGGVLAGTDLSSIQDLEKELSYEDVCLYRSMARRNHMTSKKNQVQQQNKPTPTQSWTSWLWGSSSQTNASAEDSVFGAITKEQRKELYDVLDYDEKFTPVDAKKLPEATLKAVVVAKLRKGTFQLKRDPHGDANDIISLMFETFEAKFVQRPKSSESSISLQGFSVFDGTQNTIYRQIVQVKEIQGHQNALASSDLVSTGTPNADPHDPFFFVKFEAKYRDKDGEEISKDSANRLTVRMRHMEIIYHKGYVEAMYRFFKPADSQLESVEALVGAAGHRIEGFRKETRAGLEYAFLRHQMLDIQMNINAPIIIIPEDITTSQCTHLVVDAGHIAVKSHPPDYDARERLLQHRHVYNEEYREDLISMVYDKVSLNLAMAQFVIGNDLQSCRNALTSHARDSLHLIERTDISFQLATPFAKFRSLTKVKVSGSLPTLQVNLSDTKYKSLMRLIDVCIPHFDDDAPELALPLPVRARDSSGVFPPLPVLFRQGISEYNVGGDDETDFSDEDLFFDADDGGVEPAEVKPRTLEFAFNVQSLRASLSKSDSNGYEKSLGDLSLERFSLSLQLAKFDMTVGVKLASLSLTLVQIGKDPIRFASPVESDSQENQDLLIVHYTRVQKTSPEFFTVYKATDQNVTIKISAFIFRAAPEPVLTMYDFIMATFVPQSSSKAIQSSNNQTVGVGGQHQQVLTPASSGRISVAVDVAGVQVVLVNDMLCLATLSLSTAHVDIGLEENTILIEGRLGNLALSNDSDTNEVLPDFKEIMSIEGHDLATFCYRTFDPKHDTYAGIKCSVSLNAGSIKFHVVEQPLHDIYLFIAKLAKLKGLYDAATQVAIQSVSEIERMQFNVSVKSPVLFFPPNPAQSMDVLVMRLGEINAKNASEAFVNKINASLRGIQLVSKIYYNEGPSVLKIIDDIDVVTDVVQKSNIDRTQDNDHPDNQITIRVSDIRLHLTQVQYGLLINLSRAIPRILAGSPEGTGQGHLATSVQSGSPCASGTKDEVLVDLEPELRMIPFADGSRSWTTIDLFVSVDAVKLHLYDNLATLETNIRDHGIARFALSRNTLRLKMLSDGSREAQVVLKSFTMSNTRPGGSKFREIIPAAHHDRNQFMLLFTMSGHQTGPALAILTVDSPEVLFAIDPVFALLQFFTSALSDSPTVSADEYIASHEPDPGSSEGSSVDFRIDLHDVSLSVLENDVDPDSQAIKLTIYQILLSQQGIMALTVNRLGMSLIRMGKNTESVRFLDDVDLTFSLDSRMSFLELMTSMEISAKPIVLRASYRDINLITTIVNTAFERYERTQKSNSSQEQGAETTSFTTKSSAGKHTKSSLSKSSKFGVRSLGRARILSSKEQLKGSFDGFRLVLIGDIYEQPMLHLKVKPFVVGAKDWSGTLQATATLAAQISYWNLTNSHWEPLIDPWTFTISVAKSDPFGGINATLFARERLDINISTTFAELLITTANMWGKEGARVLQKARGSYAPYQIRNRTGSPIFIWSDIDGSSNAKDAAGVKISHNQTIDWRFDDWKTMREHVSSSGQHSIRVQFIGKPWEQLRSIPVDREGEYSFSLRPRTEKYPNRLLCEVKVRENVKVVTIRSTYKIENQTLYTLELTLVDDAGRPVYSLEKIAPGQDFSLPIEAVTQNRIRLQPDQGFGYKWCPAIRWEDLVTKKGFTIKCPHTDPREAAFRFQAWVQTDNDATARKYPKLSLKLRAPLELENLLPYNLQYRIYDKNTDQNWQSYLRKGGIMPIHSVELGHLVLLNVDIQDTAFKPSDFAIINTDGQSDFDIENHLALRDAKDRKLDLKLCYVRYPDSGGAFKVQIYSPYLVVNKTSLPFMIKSVRSTRATPQQEVAGETRADALSTPTPFMLSHPYENGHEFIFKLGDSSWSKLCSLEAPAAETALIIPSQRSKSEEIHVALSWTEGLGKYKLTKVINLAPRFLIKNNLWDAISFREWGVPELQHSVIEPNDRCPLQFMRAGKENLLIIAFPGLDKPWSPPINLQDIGSVHFRLKTPGDTGVIHLIRADVKIGGSTIFVSFNRADEGWPFTIENDSDYQVTFLQTDVSRGNSESSGKPNPSYTLPSRSSMEYAWDLPSAREKKIVLIIDGARRIVDILEIGNLVPFKFQHSQAVSLDVRADGHKQILRITNYNPEHSLYRPKHHSTGTATRQDTFTNNNEGFEAVAEEAPPGLTFTVEFVGIGASLVNRKMVEVVYVTIDTLKFEYTDSAVAQAVNLSCGSLEVDNQLHDALYPVVLQPTPIVKESNGTAPLPTVQGSIIWLKDQEHGVFFIKYCSILLQALTIEADEDLLFAIYDLTQIKGASWEEGTEDLLFQQAEDIPEPHDTAVGQDLYFEILELQPIRLSLSFMRTERVSSEDKLSIRNPLAVVVNALTMTVGNINDAPLELNALAIKDMRLTLPELQSRVTYHYRQDVLRQLYRILGSADFIGNPVGLFTNVSSGVADIFYEPFNGVVMHGNKELGIGIAKGAASFVKKTVFGLSDSMTKFTSSVGKGLSAATFDSEYQNRRRMTQRRNRPRHAIYGVTAGGEALASSVASAVEGVVMKPIEGAESEGALGFFKGVGKGLVGAVTKPVVGVFDLASNVSEGIRNTTTVFDNPERDRVRLPRHVPADGVLRPYSAREALGQYWMKDLDNGIYRGDSYVAHINSPGGDNVALLTASRILSLWSRRLRLDWELPFTQVQGVTVEDTGIRFAHKAGKASDKFVLIPDKSSQSWFFGQVALVVKSFNARRRMDA